LFVGSGVSIRREPLYPASGDAYINDQ
jgi:hypothetical protein